MNSFSKNQSNKKTKKRQQYTSNEAAIEDKISLFSKKISLMDSSIEYLVLLIEQQLYDIELVEELKILMRLIIVIRKKIFINGNNNEFVSIQVCVGL